MKKTWIVLLAVVVLGGVYLWSVAQPRNSVSNAPAMDHENKKIPHVGISMTTSHPVWATVRQGVEAGFRAGGYIDGEDVVLDFQDAHGDAATSQVIAQKFANEDYQLLMPFGTQATQLLTAGITNRPIVFVGVTDPVAAGFVTSKEQPGGNVTGSSNITLYREQIQLLQSLAPAAKIIGIVYNPSEINAASGLEAVRKIAAEKGLEVITATVNNSGDVLAAARSIASKVDAFYMLPDNTVIAGQEALVKVAIDSKKPLIALEESGVAAGALAALGTDFFQLGHVTAALAIQILKGAAPSTTPVLDVTAANVFVNTTTAKAIGLTMPADVLKQAERVY